MPFNVWCGGCRHMIAKGASFPQAARAASSRLTRCALSSASGVRFNAEKRAVGKYFSTKIWAFTMKTPCCSTEVEIHTDPKACEYVIVRGAERKVETYSAEDAGTVALPSAAEREEARADPIRRLEGASADVAYARAAAPSIAELQQRSRDTSGDDYTANKALRRAMRAQRVSAAAANAERDALGLPEHVPLLPPAPADAAAAAAVRFGPGFDGNRAMKRAALCTGSIFGAPGAKKPRAAAPLQPGGEAAERARALAATRARMEASGVRFAGSGGAQQGGAAAFGGALRAAPPPLRPARPRG
jgi:coiled-coil domain-containing protein 130